MAHIFKIKVYGDVSSTIKKYFNYYLLKLVRDIEYIPLSSCLNKPFVRDIMEGKYVIELIKDEKIFKIYKILNNNDIQKVYNEIKMVLLWNS